MTTRTFTVTVTVDDGATWGDRTPDQIAEQIICERIDYDEDYSVYGMSGNYQIGWA